MAISVEGWKNCCDLLVDEEFVLEAFYTMVSAFPSAESRGHSLYEPMSDFQLYLSQHQYVDSVTSVATNEIWKSVISEGIRSQLVIWSVEIVGGVGDLLQLIEDDEQALSKVERAIA